MLVFVDSSFIIADVRKEDENHERAIGLHSSTSKKRVISDLVLGETLTYIKFHDSAEKARQLGEKLVSLEEMTIAIPTVNDLKDALEILGKYEKLSFCDAVIVAQMKSNNITQLLSFDSDFDLIPGIERIH